MTQRLLMPRVHGGTLRTAPKNSCWLVVMEALIKSSSLNSMMNLKEERSLDFRSLLNLLANAFKDREFTARDVHDLLIKPLFKLAPDRPDLVFKSLLRYRTKLISNDLRRLYFMGFLKRRRVKRRCRTKSGKICFRGYEYRYSISSQGWKYLKYLAGGQREDGDEDAKGLIDILVRQWIEETAPEDMKKSLWEFYKTPFNEKRGFKRFPKSKDGFWEKLIEYRWKLVRDEKISELERRVKELEDENKKLKEEKKTLETKCHFLYALLKYLGKIQRCSVR